MMPLPYQRMAQVPDSLIHYIDMLRGGGFYHADDAVPMRHKIMDDASRLRPGEDVVINLANIHFADETARAALTLRMNDKQQITWSLELPS